MPVSTFEFSRARGIVWVCDIEKSSSYLNDDVSVDAIEQFLPRLHWTAIGLVEAAGGTFVKWTGDGFLAWFEMPLYRSRGQVAAMVFMAAWHLSFLVNITQLGLDQEYKIKIRHGITLEHDALELTIKYPDGHEEIDLIGRAVVLAFRISGILAPFPGIVTQKDLADAAQRAGWEACTFEGLDLTKEEILKFFKGEKQGTRDICSSSERQREPATMSEIAAQVSNVIDKAKGKVSTPSYLDEFTQRYIGYMSRGPDWSRKVIDQELQFIRNDMLGTLESFQKLLGSLDDTDE